MGRPAYFPPAEYVNVISDAIRRYRAQHKITESEFGALVGRTEKGIQNLEKGVCLPSARTLRLIARLMEWDCETAGRVVMELPDAPRRYFRERATGEGAGGIQGAEGDHSRRDGGGAWGVGA